MAEIIDVTNTPDNKNDSTSNSSDDDDQPEVSEEASESFVKTALNRQGSVNYRNEAWKPSPPRPPLRLDSRLSSARSSSSHPASPVSKSPIAQEATPLAQQAFMEAQFMEIYSILKSCNVDEEVLLKIKG